MYFNPFLIQQYVRVTPSCTTDSYVREYFDKHGPLLAQIVVDIRLECVVGPVPNVHPTQWRSNVWIPLIQTCPNAMMLVLAINHLFQLDRAWDFQLLPITSPRNQPNQISIYSIMSDFCNATKKTNKKSMHRLAGFASKSKLIEALESDEHARWFSNLNMQLYKYSETRFGGCTPTFTTARTLCDAFEELELVDLFVDACEPTIRYESQGVLASPSTYVAELFALNRKLRNRQPQATSTCDDQTRRFLINKFVHEIGVSDAVGDELKQLLKRFDWDVNAKFLNIVGKNFKDLSGHAKIELSKHMTKTNRTKAMKPSEQ